MVSVTVSTVTPAAALTMTPLLTAFTANVFAVASYDVCRSVIATLVNNVITSLSATMLAITSPSKAVSVTSLPVPPT